MRPLSLTGSLWGIVTKNRYRATISEAHSGFNVKEYDHVDVSNDYDMPWSSGEVAGEYKYKIYFYEGNDVFSQGDKVYGVNSKYETDYTKFYIAKTQHWSGRNNAPPIGEFWTDAWEQVLTKDANTSEKQAVPWVNNYIYFPPVKRGTQHIFNKGVNKDSAFFECDGKYYTRGGYAERLDSIFSNITKYNFGLTLKYVGYEIKKDPRPKSLSNYKDIYGYYEKETTTTGLDFDDTTKITSNYSNHHFSVWISYGDSRNFVVSNDKTNVLATINDYLLGLYGKNILIEHEFLHCLKFAHVFETGSLTWGLTNLTKAPFMQGIILHNSDASVSSLGLSEDGIHGIDTIYNLRTGNRLIIKGRVDLDSLKIAEVERDEQGNSTGNSSNYLGKTYIFLCDTRTNEIYYQSVVDDTGYYEFVIRVPNRYINTLENIKFYLFAVSSHFGDNYQYKVRPKSNNSSGIPIFWGKSTIQDLNSVTLPYTLDLSASKIKLINKSYPTKLNETTWGSDVFDVLKKESGVVVTYKQYTGITNQLEVESNFCGVK